MRVLFLLSSLEPAGSETYCLALAKAWQGRHSIFWISDRLHFGQQYESLPIHAKAFPGGVINTIKVARFIRENQIELVHSHSRRSHWVAAQAAALTGIPHVTTIHQPPPVHLFSQLFPCLGTIAIAIDEVVVEHLTRHFRRSPEKIRLIRNGIDIPPPVLFQSQQPKRVALLGRLTGGRWHAFLFFLEVLERIGRTLPPTHFLIAGRVPEERAAFLKMQLETLGAAIAPSTIQATGWTDRLGKFIGGCDGVIGAGRSGLESLALGRPVILLGEGGVIGLAGPDTWEQALRTNLGDHLQPKQFYPAKLEVALRELLTPEFDIAERSRWGRAQVEKQYDIRDVAAQVEKVYQDVL